MNVVLVRRRGRSIARCVEDTVCSGLESETNFGRRQIFVRKTLDSSEKWLRRWELGPIGIVVEN